MDGEAHGMNYEKKLRALDREIFIDVNDTKAGINILIAGGDKGHIGAVAAALSGKITGSITFPGHKENVICETWAKEISEIYNGPVVVEAGVHYDKITKEQICKALEILNTELEQLVKHIRQTYRTDI